jgi:hypothetical protein
LARTVYIVTSDTILMWEPTSTCAAVFGTINKTPSTGISFSGSNVPKAFGFTQQTGAAKSYTIYIV